MIKPLSMNNVSFKSADTMLNIVNPLKKAETPAPAPVVQPEPQVQTEEITAEEKKFSVKDAAIKTKNTFLNGIKGINNVTCTSAGVIRGMAEGIAVAGITGLIGKNIKSSERDIFKSIKGILKDTGSALWNTIKFVPSVLTKSPVENIKTISSLPAKFYKEYLKGNKATGAIATAAALLMVALRTIQGKFRANFKNTDIEHATRTDHAKKTK